MKITNDLLPSGKNENWTVVYSEDGIDKVIHLESRDDVFMELISFKDTGVEMENVFVFPPKVSLKFTEFLSHT